MNDLFTYIIPPPQSKKYFNNFKNYRYLGSEKIISDY